MKLTPGARKVLTDAALALAGCAVVVALMCLSGSLSYQAGRADAITEARRAAPAPSSLPPLVEDSPEVKAAFSRQERLFDRCRIGGGYPVWGLGYQTVCLKPSFVEWAEDPLFPKEAH